MSQGLTWIAGRRIPLLALVALLALTVGLFAAFQPAHAALGDVSATSGTCQADNTIEDADSADITVTTADSGGNLVETLVDCDGADDAGKTVKVTPDGTELPIVEVQAPSLSIAFGDTDGVVSDDNTLDVSVSIANFNGFAIGAISLAYIRVSGVLDISGAPAANTAILETAPLPRQASSFPTDLP